MLSSKFILYLRIVCCIFISLESWVISYYYNYLVLIIPSHKSLLYVITKISQLSLQNIPVLRLSKSIFTIFKEADTLNINILARLISHRHLRIYIILIEHQGMYNLNLPTFFLMVSLYNNNNCDSYYFSSKNSISSIVNWHS